MNAPIGATAAPPRWSCLFFREIWRDEPRFRRPRRGRCRGSPSRRRRLVGCSRIGSTGSAVLAVRRGRNRV